MNVLDEFQVYLTSVKSNNDNFILKIYIHFIYCFTRLPSGKPMIDLTFLTCCGKEFHN